MNLSLPSLCGRLLREPQQVVEEADDLTTFGAVVPRLLGITLVGLGILGAVVGSQSGAYQLVYAAVKTPFLILLPTLVGLPAVRALWQCSDLVVSYRRLALAGLAGTARSSVLAAGVAPVYWFFVSLDVSYHWNVLLFSATIVIVGVPGLWTLGVAIPPGGRRRLLSTLGSVAVVGFLLAQTGWVLRPFVARPQAEVSFLRPMEEDVFSSLISTTASALGVYGTWRPTRVRASEGELALCTHELGPRCCTRTLGGCQ
jgi:hypothetical protein